jgi:hypothetical protein
MMIEQPVILQNALPEGQAEVAAARLPSVLPVQGPWLRMDEAYAAQMALRRRLLGEHEREVYAQRREGLGAARSYLGAALENLPEGFDVQGGTVVCPDGVRVTLEWDAPLWTVGNLLQQDVCILEKSEAEHVMTGAVLCFPASWTLAQKIGRPLVGIHDPVAEYDAGIAARVQRLFDGVQPDKPVWRANLLKYRDPALYQPRPEYDPRPAGLAASSYIRSERQTILRLPVEGAVAFTIHTSVVSAG